MFDSEDKCPGTPSGIVVDDSGCPLDSDKDGVPDYMDNCPNTKMGIPVSKNGCPSDSDGDGVPDYLDQCPNTPHNVTVNFNGCPFDSDNDGVPDYLDKCDNTPPGTKVDANGCPVVLNKTSENSKNQEVPETKLKVETPKYNTGNEVFVTPQILTDGSLYVIQLSSWKTEQKADRVVDRLKEEGYNAFIEKSFISKWRSIWYRVRIGYFNSYEQAKEYLKNFSE